MKELDLKLIKQLNRLKLDVRAKVDEIVSAHLAARKKLGTPAEDMNRVYLEAIEVAKLEVRQKDTVSEWGVFEPLRKYDVYTAPREP